MPTCSTGRGAHPRLALRLAVAVLFTACLPSTHAQHLLVGTGDRSPGADNDVWLIDLADGSATKAFGGVSVWAMTTDADRTVWLTANSGGLYTWSIDDPAPILLGTVSPDAPATNQRFDGLGFSDGTLFGWQQFDDVDTGAPAGLYAIDPTTTPINTTFIGTDANTGDISGMDADPIEQDQLFGVSDGGPLAGDERIVTIDAATGNVTFFANYPPTETDIDAIAIGDGKAWLVEDEPGDIYEIDLDTGAIITSFPTPFAIADTFGAATYIPADTTACNPADLSSPADPGVPDGTLTGADFFEFLARFQAGDLSIDYSSPSDPGTPDGRLTGADFFAFLDLFSQGC